MFDGQSLNNEPQTSSFPSLVMAGRPQSWCNAAISGQSWTSLGPSATSRRDLLLGHTDRTVLVMTGGTQDIIDGDSAATVLSDMAAYATAARAAGADRIIASTITPSTAFSGANETVRQAANALIRASAAFDGIADIAAHPHLGNTADTTYYTDGTHWTPAGAADAASVVAPVLTAVLATL